ncbi:MAG: murein biosynthesis integral membrane protein MurJ [Chloroflexota bacterium]
MAVSGTTPHHSPLAAHHFAWAAAIVMAGTVLSRLLGLVRQQVLAIEFGTTPSMDAFWTAFKIPDAIFTLVAGGVLSSSLIPVFTGYLSHNQREKAVHVASAIITTVLAVLGAAALLLELLAPELVPLLTATYSPDRQALVVDLTRVLLIQPIFLAVSGVMMGILQSYQHFLLPALAPVVYNLSIIAAALVLGPNLGVEGLAIGVVAGAVLQVALQYPAMRHHHFRYRPLIDWKDEGVREVLRLMFPRVFASASLATNFLVSAALASALQKGAYTGFNIAFSLMQLPLGIFAIAISVVAFPTLSAQVAQNDIGSMSRTLLRSLRFILFLVIPSTVGLVLLREPIVRTLFQYGAFTARSTALTTQPLIFFALGLFGHATVEIVLRGFYALHETLRPVLINVVTLALNLGLSFAFVGSLAQGGLALAMSIAVGLEALALLVLLSTRLPGFDWAALAGGALRCLVAALAMGLALYVFVHGSNARLDLQAIGPRVLQLVGGLGVAGLVYLGAAYVLRVPEVGDLRRLARR